jgi:hypothetical protein
MTPEDLRAAVQAGILTEAQAAGVKALAEDRAGRRARLPAEDEPFEFFRGFSEIFISLGLVILMSGLVALVLWVGGLGMAMAVPAAVAAVSWWWAGYFTLKRRMNLPSMVLVLAFGGGVWLFVLAMMLKVTEGDIGARITAILPALIAALALLLWYRRFRLPFTMFVLGGFVLTALYGVTASGTALEAFIDGSRTGFGGFFDLGQSPAFATATLIFGLGAFAAGMWFDLRDPHRLGRYAATAFWLHLMAAPALVNTVALSLYNSGSGANVGLLALALLAITLLALVIDRRSFLTAALGYIAIVIFWILGDTGDFGNWVAILLVMGALITAAGTWWVQLRRAVLNALPDFPGKGRLPPWAA